MPREIEEVLEAQVDLDPRETEVQATQDRKVMLEQLVGQVVQGLKASRALVDQELKVMLVVQEPLDMALKESPDDRALDEQEPREIEDQLALEDHEANPERLEPASGGLNKSPIFNTIFSWFQNQTL